MTTPPITHAPPNRLQNVGKWFKDRFFSFPAGFYLIASPMLFLAFLIPAFMYTTLVFTLGNMTFFLVAFIMAWLILAFALSPFTSASGANTRAYGELHSKLIQLKLQLDVLSPTINNSADPNAKEALSEAQKNYEQADLLLEGKTPCMRWVLGTGYVEVERFAHIAEEALVECESLASVIDDALLDDQRLNGSGIEMEEQLRDSLRCAVSVLAPGVALCLFPTLSSGNPAPNTTAPNTNAPAPVTEVAATGAPGNESPDPNKVPNPMTLARKTIRGVHRTINTYRDDNRTGLVVARGRLMSAIIVVELMTIFLVLFAMLNGINHVMFVGALWVYLIGIMFGLIGRLYTDFKNQMAVDDLGLSLTRLTATLPLSGLAAIGGVIFVHLATNGAPIGVGITQIFDIVQYQANIVIAAVFGLTPGLLIQGFQEQAAKYQNNLKTSQPPYGKTSIYTYKSRSTQTGS